MKYRKYGCHSSPKEYQLIKQHVPLCPTGEQLSVLDVGCGDFTIIKQVFEELGYRYIGIDYDPEASAVRCDAHYLPFKNNVFSVIFSGESLEHFHSPWLVVSEIGRVTKEGALFIGYVPQLYPFHGDSYFNYTFMGIQRMLELGNFESDEIKLGYTVGESLLSAYIAPYGIPRLLLLVAKMTFYIAMRARKWVALLYLQKNTGKLSAPTQQKIRFSLKNGEKIFAGGLIFLAHKNSQMKKRWQTTWVFNKEVKN
jgi:SAM-dependent methyltransferase